MRFIIFCLILSFAAYSCKKNEVRPNVDQSSKYYPVAEGYTWIYEVDSIVFYGNLNQAPDTFHYLVKHTIQSSTVNSTGITTYIVDKSIKKENHFAYQFNTRFAIQKSTLEIVYNTVGARIPILTFPITNDKEWSGNLYSQRDEWNSISGRTNEVECSYTDVHTPKTIQNIVYDSTCTVIRSKEENAIHSRFTNEIFAANVGLVSKYFENVENYDTDDPKGSIYTYTLKSFEK